MRNIVMIFLFNFILLSCEKDKKIQTTTLDLNEFTIDIPSTWIYQQNQGYDSFVGDIKIDDNEKIDFDYGWHSNHLDVDNLTHFINYQTIDGKKAKIVSPKSFKKGTTGVYLDSLEITKIWKFQLSGINLSKNNQILLLKSIESLKFKD
jgi:hypothetical protein